MSVLQNINGTLYRMDASDLSQLAAVDTEGILGGTPGATTNGQTLVDQLAADDVQAQTDIGQIRTDLSDYHVIPSKNLFSEIKTGVFLWGSAQDGYNVGTATNGFVAIGAVETGEQYVVTKNNVGNRFRLVLFKDYPTSTSDLTAALVYDSNGATDYTFTVPSGGYKYLVGGFNNTDAYSGDIQPMLCTAADYAADPSYEPYFLPMRDGKLDIADEQVLGAWNMLDNRLTTQTSNGITVTVGSKKEVRVTTGSSAPTQLVNFRILPEKIGLGNLVVGKTYYLTGCPAGGLGGIYCLVIGRDHPGGSFDTLVDSGDGLEFTYDGSWTCRYVLLQIGTPVGANFDKTFYPMITTKKGAPYVPYTMTNRELTDAPNWNSTNAIANNTDLNDLKDGRRHFCQSGSTASTLTHCPVSVAFVLDVIIFNSDASAFLQILQPIDGDKMFKRNYASGAWGSWYKFTGTAV